MTKITKVTKIKFNATKKEAIKEKTKMPNKKRSPGNRLLLHFPLIHFDNHLHLLLLLKHVIDILLQFLNILRPALEVHHQLLTVHYFRLLLCILDLKSQLFAVLFRGVYLTSRFLYLRVKLVQRPKKTILIFLYENELLTSVSEDLNHCGGFLLQLVEVLISLLDFLIQCLR